MRSIIVSVFCALILICPIPIFAQGADAGKIKAYYYVSSSKGNDSYDGLTDKTPKQHIYAVGEKENVHILLKRGDVFFEQIKEYNNCIFEDYGKGEKPVLCGFKVLKNPQAWTYDKQEGLWKIDLMKEDDFTGMIHGDVEDDRINNIGFIYNPGADKIYGKRVRYLKEMTENERFFITEQFVTDSIKSDTFRYLRWKLDADPRKIKNLCFPMWLIGIRHMNNCTIRNIAIVGFNFGIVTCDGTLIDNCQIDLIGGSVAIGFNGWVRYGNGIEFSWGNKNSLIKNCLISRTFDCGATIQASGNFRGSPVSICFVNNRFYHCRQAFEFFLNPSNESRPQYQGCSFNDNICYMMGENEFSQPEPRDANLLSYDRFGKSISIEGNVFFGSSHYCGASYPIGMKDNIVYIYEGQYLTHYHDRRQYPSVYANSKKDIESYRIQNGDNSTFTILKEGTVKAKRVGRKIRKKVGWMPVDLRLESL